MVSLAKRLGPPQEYHEDELPRLVYPIIEEAMRVDTSRGPSFSKILCVVVILLTIVVSIATVCLAIYLNDLTPLEYLIPSVFAEASVVSGFYSYKAKAENKIKLETRRLILEKVLNAEMPEGEDDFEENS